jgi:hypothetical protein
LAYDGGTPADACGWTLAAELGAAGCPTAVVAATVPDAAAGVVLGGPCAANCALAAIVTAAVTTTRRASRDRVVLALSDRLAEQDSLTRRSFVPGIEETAYRRNRLALPAG